MATSAEVAYAIRTARRRLADPDNVEAKLSLEDRVILALADENATLRKLAEGSKL